jgi:hypothetical protein
MMNVVVLNLLISYVFLCLVLWYLILILSIMMGFDCMICLMVGELFGFAMLKLLYYTISVVYLYLILITFYYMMIFVCTVLFMFVALLILVIFLVMIYYNSFFVVKCNSFLPDFNDVIIGI